MTLLLLTWTYVARHTYQLFFKMSCDEYVLHFYMSIRGNLLKENDKNIKNNASLHWNAIMVRCAALSQIKVQVKQSNIQQKSPSSALGISTGKKKNQYLTVAAGSTE